MRLCCALMLLTAAATPASPEEPAAPVPTRVYDSRRVAEPPTIDGLLDDPAWEAVEWSGDFVQREPDAGAPPAQPTELKVVFDDHALYFAFRLHDDPEQLSSILARRDRFPGDLIEVNIDSYFDRRTAFSFTLSLSGTRGDELVSNNGDTWNPNWDAVWNGATRIDPEGWTAEIRIPLSQLRFSGHPEQTWGLQVNRRIFRFDELSTWQYIPKDVSGWVSNFGHLKGLRDLEPKRRIELLPYAVARSERAAAEAGNPFAGGTDSSVDGGLDGKVGVTNNLTVDFTINPDFGQVEADPSEVNLTAFETFFSEKRPFFIEGNDIFDLPLAPAVTGGPFTRDRLFYSRRIGRSPGFDAEAPDGGYVDQPEATTILGAFKLSGRTANGLSIGLLESVTQKEEATLAEGNERTRQTVEPLTSYFVARLQQDWNDGDRQLGGMLTAVHRRLDDEHLDFMPEEAFAAGLDFSTYFHQRDYRFEASFLGSQLRGSETAMLEAQESSARYFQRPDNEAASLDATRTSLSGHAGSFRLSRTNNHQLVFQTGVAWRSPGFEINDLGFMRSADGINQFTWVAYQQRNPVGVFDGFEINGNQWLDWDFGGNFLGARFNVNANARFRNKSRLGVEISRDGESTSNTELRGGPASRWPGSWSYGAWGGTDHRKKLAVQLGTWARRGDEDSEDSREAWTLFIWRPTNAARLTLRPTTTRSRRELQYVTTETSGGEDRFLFGRLDQETLFLTLRLDYSITPDLTVQLYASPFLSTGRYTDFKRIIAPKASAYRDRFRLFAPEEIAYDAGTERFEVDEDLDGTVDYGFESPDFDARDFNSNLVIRWEYSPGSAVFLVWSQVRENSSLLVDALDPRRDFEHLFATHPRNIVLLKVSKWFSP